MLWVSLESLNSLLIANFDARGGRSISLQEAFLQALGSIRKRSMILGWTDPLLLHRKVMEPKDPPQPEVIVSELTDNETGREEVGEVNLNTQESWGVPQVPCINDVSLRLAQTASYFGRRIINMLEEEPVNCSSGMGQILEDDLRHTGTTTATTTTTAITVESTPSSSGESHVIVATQNGISSNPVERATSIWAALGQSFLNSSPVPWQGLMARVQTTLRGSADDIGWLQKTPGFPPVEDGTERFEQLLDNISHGLHTLPNDYVYLLIPGLFSNHGPLYFVDTKRYFSKLGLTCHIARIHSEAAVETNARELKDYIEELYWGTGKKVVLLGHSKGGVDAAAAASMFWPEIKDKIVGMVLVQSPYGGSPLASDILREGQIADVETRRIMEILICKVIKGDMTALEDLTHDRRRKFLAKYPLPEDLPVVCFHTEAGKSPGVLSTLSHIAHAELPWLPLSYSYSSSSSSAAASDQAPATTAKLPVVLPLAAAMAACAVHLELRYGEKSDGLVSRKDAEVPGSVVVRPNRKLDHAWMVYSTDPEAFRMCEALMNLLLEVSQRKRFSSNGSGSNASGGSSV